jgi:UPF0716 family protein affecting phage T7 exclusion
LNPVARREIPVAIATLVLWVLTAAAGLVLLTAGGAAKRAAAQQAAGAQQAGAPGTAGVQETVPVPAPPVMVPGTDAAQGAAASPGAGPGSARPVPAPLRSMAGRAEPPPIPRVKVHATPGEHPLLEFSHPLLGLIGLGVWFIFLGTHHAPLAWVAFGILVAAIAAGLSWLARNALAARRGERPARAGFPPRLVLVHGLAASATFVVAVLAALTASHV